MAGIRYKGQIFSGSASFGTADHVAYDNTQSGLAATDVQDALDEVSNKLATTVTTISGSTFYKSGNVITVKLAENNVTVSANIAFITIPSELRPQIDMDYIEPISGKRIFFCTDGRVCFNENVSNLTVRGTYTYII